MFFLTFEVPISTVSSRSKNRYINRSFHIFVGCFIRDMSLLKHNGGHRQGDGHFLTTSTRSGFGGGGPKPWVRFEVEVGGGVSLFVLLMEDIRQTHQLRLIVYPIIYRFFLTSQVVSWISVINSMSCLY